MDKCLTRQKDLLLYDLYIAYQDARKHKRKTHNHRVFEEHLEDNLVQLCDDLLSRNYVISPSIYFIQQHPIQREIFAWNFRDRIVHHLVYNYISPYWEKQFIYDSYSCRKWKWTKLGIQRLAKFMRSCSENYTKESWILKLDIQGYFMAIDKHILRKKVSSSFPILQVPVYFQQTVHDIIFNDPTINGVFKWKHTDYKWLPKTKSLFFTDQYCGLPIGNLTSQLFSNIYLNDFDHFVRDNLHVRYYGRYVDDFVLIDTSKEKLKQTIPLIRTYLYDHLHLTLHPNKMYLQPVTHWVWFLGAVIKPYRTYIQKKTIGQFYKKIQASWWRLPKSVIASYLWFLSHHKSYKITQKLPKFII